MKVLVIGGGGREHALVWKLRQSSDVERIFCIPGNAGIAELAECAKFDLDDLPMLARFAKGKKVDLTVVGPEIPLVNGIVNIFEAYGLTIFGPTEKAAQIEGSKIFAKNLMQKYGIPTARTETFFDNYGDAISWVNQLKYSFPYVVKADGLAGGKGVSIVTNVADALQFLEKCFVDEKFGAAGKRVLIEEYLEGLEASVFVLTDGNEVVSFGTAEDYKRLLDGDEGPNTGGMGSISPAPTATKTQLKKMIEIMKVAIGALRSEGTLYKGILYGGFILTSEGPKVLEFNCRFGDPETQAILPRFKGDLAKILYLTSTRKLDEVTESELKFDPKPCVSVTIASKGYPENPETGDEIRGIEYAADVPGVTIFHAGTSQMDNKIVTAGGRVLNVSAVGNDFPDASARQYAYKAINWIKFEGMQFRTDIAANLYL